jgi:hypothetical protein
VGRSRRTTTANVENSTVEDASSRPIRPPPAVGSLAMASRTEALAMRRAVELAARGAGSTLPNPVVGCVILSAGGVIVGEGWHERPGGPPRRGGRVGGRGGGGPRRHRGRLSRAVQPRRSHRALRRRPSSTPASPVS